MLEYDGKFYLFNNGIPRPFQHKISDNAIKAWRAKGWRTPTKEEVESWLNVKTTEKPVEKSTDKPSNTEDDDEKSPGQNGGANQLNLKNSPNNKK